MNKEVGAPAECGSRHGRIVVLGMHRSGTSCVGELLAQMGAYFGPERFIRGSTANPHGLFERPDLRAVCHFMLQAMRAEWWVTSRVSPDRVQPPVRAAVREMLKPILAELNAHEPWFIKEPRLCLLLPMLAEHLGRVVVVRVWRHPLEVAESLRARDAIPIEFGVALWERHVRASFAAGGVGALVSYNRLVADPLGGTRKLLDDLTALGIAGLRMPDEGRLASVIDPALRRSKPVVAGAGGILTPAQQRLLAALEAGDPDHPELAAAFAPEQHVRLLALEAARRRQMATAAYRALDDAGKSAAGGHSLGHRARAALRYLPLNPVKWVGWLRRGVLRRRLRQQVRAGILAASGRFDPAWYAARYPDVARSRADPLLHFVRFGAGEGRDPAPSCSTMRHLHSVLEAADGARRASAGESHR